MAVYYIILVINRNDNAIYKIRIKTPKPEYDLKRTYNR